VQKRTAPRPDRRSPQRRSGRSRRAPSTDPPADRGDAGGGVEASSALVSRVTCTSGLPALQITNPSPATASPLTGRGAGQGHGQKKAALRRPWNPDARRGGKQESADSQR
jgi:hypothetical protein